MKPHNRETLQRAIGIIDGVSYAVKNPVGDALTAAIELLDQILDDEEGVDENGQGNIH